MKVITRAILEAVGVADSEIQVFTIKDKRIADAIGYLISKGITEITSRDDYNKMLKPSLEHDEELYSYDYLHGVLPSSKWMWLGYKIISKVSEGTKVKCIVHTNKLMSYDCITIIKPTDNDPEVSNEIIGLFDEAAEDEDYMDDSY